MGFLDTAETRERDWVETGQPSGLFRPLRASPSVQQMRFAALFPLNAS